MPDRNDLPAVDLPLFAPVAEKRPVARVIQGEKLVDDYAWLKADNWQEVLHDPVVLPGDVRAYLDAENAYATAALAPLEGLQAELLAEFRGRIKEDDSSVPMADGAWEYYERYRAKGTVGGDEGVGGEIEAGEHALLCRKPRGGGAGAREQILLDGDLLARGKAFYEIGDDAIDRSHTRLAWSEDDAGSEFYTIRVKDVGVPEKHRILPDVVAGTDGSVVWDGAGQGFFYIRLSENHRPEGVFYHRLGTHVESDHCVYREDDAGFFVGIGQTLDDTFLVISCHDHATSESWLVGLDNPLETPRLVKAREAGITYEVGFHPGCAAVGGGRAGMFISTNAPEKAGSEKAWDGRLVWVALDALPLADWSGSEVVGRRAGHLLEDFEVCRDWLVWQEMHEALPRIFVASLKENTLGKARLIEMPEPVYSLSFGLGREFVTDTLRYEYSSLTTPDEVWDMDMRTGDRTLRKRQEVPSGHNPADYVAERRWAVAADGERIPVSLFYKKGRELGGPGYLTGYGAYGAVIPAEFRIAPLSLVDRGFVWAWAHIRGGRDKGEGWYQAGKMERKENTFGDFIAVAEMLCADGLVARGKLAAVGRSAGGMLMGAVANRAPAGLIGAMIADVPFVDVLNTMLDGDLPLTPPEWPEWGNPGADVQAFRRLRGYSPYDNVSAKDYPPLLVQAGLTDPRVTYWEPAKWVAKLREVKTGANPLLLVTNMTAGHAGASGRFEGLKETARELAFVLATVGI